MRVRAFDVTGANALTYNGVITGPGSLTKVDTGTLALGGASTYTGGTNISAGTLQMLPGGLLAFGQRDHWTARDVAFQRRLCKHCHFSKQRN